MSQRLLDFILSMDTDPAKVMKEGVNKTEEDERVESEWSFDRTNIHGTMTNDDRDDMNLYLQPPPRKKRRNVVMIASPPSTLPSNLLSDTIHIYLLSSFDMWCDLQST